MWVNWRKIKSGVIRMIVSVEDRYGVFVIYYMTRGLGRADEGKTIFLAGGCAALGEERDAGGAVGARGEICWWGDGR
jgi:hypothetical protein